MKTAIVTGASRGVGRAIAERLAGEGYRLLINCRSRFELLDHAAAELSAKTSCIPIHGKISGELLERYLGGSAVSQEELLLVNNGGISRFQLAQEVTDGELMELMEANLLSMFRLCRVLIPYLLRSGNGRILNISSVWGICGASMESVYSMTKGGVNAFTRALGRELAPSRIPVNAIALGAVDTDMNSWMGEEERAALNEEIPFGRMASVSEAAEFAMLLLKSPRYLTGQVIQFDGGWI